VAVNHFLACSWLAAPKDGKVRTFNSIMAIYAEKLEAPTLRKQIADRIRASVLQGALKPGEKIVERDLAAQFGTSLTAVREAVIQLETEGLIIKRPNASTAVVQLSTQEVLDIFAVRRELERYAVVEAARRITDEECELLAELHEQAVSAAMADDASRYIQADLCWHQAIWRITRNSYLESALQRVIVRLFGFSYIQHAAGFNLLEDAYSHRELLNTILQKDPQAAEAAFATVVETWMDYALSFSDTD
jgi:DNA-binding GntR family transcriptional regulator